MLLRVFTAAPRTLAYSAATLVASLCKKAGHGQTVPGSGKDAREHGKEALQRARRGGILSNPRCGGNGGIELQIYD